MLVRWGCLAIVLVAWGCSSDECHIEAGDGGSFLVCPDGSRAPLGPSCVVSTGANGVRWLACPDGTTAIADHSLCSVIVESGGKVIACEGDSRVQISGTCDVTELGQGARRVTCDDETRIVLYEGATGVPCARLPADGGDRIVCVDGSYGWQAAEPLTPEAGEVDAGEVDAGQIDAGEIDAGPIDAGEVDGGEVDAGEIDAGEIDAGEIDAGPIDAGEIDAGPIDAGPIDAGPIDAGPLDAGTPVVGPPTTTAACYDNHWCWEHPLPGPIEADVMWARRDDDLQFFSAEEVFRWNGTKWSGGPGPTGTRTFAATSANDAWTGAWHFDGTAWTKTSETLTPLSLAAASPSLAWVINSGGSPWEWNGTAWRQIAAPSQLGGLIWGTSSNDLWTFGSVADNAQHWNGAAWSLVPMRPSDVVGVVGRGPSDITAFTNANGLVHWDGAAWTPVPNSTTSSGGRITAFAPDDAWKGSQKHWNGTAWESTGGSTTSAFVSRSPSGEMWATWAAGTTGLERRTASGWAPLLIDGRKDLTLDRAPFVAVGPLDFWSGVYHYDGTGWTKTELPVGMSSANATWPLAANDVWAVGGTGRIAHWNGAAWTLATSPTTAELTGVWGAASNDIWAFGAGVLLHWNGTAWSTTTPPATFTHLTGASTNEVWGFAGTAIWRWDGATWSLATAPPPVTYPLVQHFEAFGPGSIAAANDAWMLGFEKPATALRGLCKLWHWNGTTWTAELTVTNNDGSVFVRPSFVRLAPDLVSFVGGASMATLPLHQEGRRQADGTWVWSDAFPTRLSIIVKGYAPGEAWGLRKERTLADGGLRPSAVAHRMP